MPLRKDYVITFVGSIEMYALYETLYYNITRMTHDIEFLTRLQLVPSVYCLVEIYYERFDSKNCNE